MSIFVLRNEKPEVLAYDAKNSAYCALQSVKAQITAQEENKSTSNIWGLML
jgi:hypothetical protein